MHSDIHGEDYFDPNTQVSETICESEVSEGRKRKLYGLLSITFALTLIFFSSYGPCGKSMEKNKNEITIKK